MASGTRTSSRTSRSIPTKDKRFGGAFYSVSPGAGRFGVGLDARFSWRSDSAGSGIEPAGDRAGRGVRAAVQQPEGAGSGILTAWHATSIATASPGRRSRADIWRASIGASARGRSTGRRRPDSTAPKGWTLYPEPLPQLKGVTDSGSAEGSYYTWVDQFDTLGLGREHPDQHRQRVRRAAGAEGWQVGRAPRSVSDRVLHEVAGRPDRRSERPAGRAKGSGRPSARERRSTWKAGKGTTSKVVKFQLRPDPLAK